MTNLNKKKNDKSPKSSDVVEQELELEPELEPEPESESESKKPNGKKPSLYTNKDKKRKKSFHVIGKTLKILYHLISDITIHVENSKISDIPFVLIDDNMSVRDYYNEVRPKSSLEFYAKSVSYNITRIYDDAAGFEVLFNPKTDNPFHLTCTIQLIKLYFIKRVKLSTGHFGLESDEVLNIPNCSFTHKTNLLGQIVKAKGFENCVMELYFSTSTPIFDIDAKQLSAILYNIVLLRKWSKLRRLRKFLLGKGANNKTELGEPESGGASKDNGGHNDANMDDHNTEIESLKSQLWHYANEYYPKLDIKFVIEQPRFILRHYEEGKKTQILSFSYSLLNFNLSTTESRDYASTFSILYPSILYHEKSALDATKFNNEIVKKNIAKLDYLNIKLDIFKNLTVKASVELNTVNVNLTSLEIFRGIHWLLLDVTKLSETDLLIGTINKAFNDEIDVLRRELRSSNIKTGSFSADASTLEQKIFRALPSWFEQLDLKILSVNIFLGARSVLIPTKDLFHSDSPNFEYDTDDNKDLRKLNVKLKLFSVTISNNQLLSFAEPQSPNSSILNSLESQDLLASLETLTSLQDTSYWSVITKLEQLNIFMPDDNSTKLSASELFIDIPSFTGTIDSLSDYYCQNKLLTAFTMDEVDINYNTFKLFTLIGSVYLIREFIVSPISMIKLKLRKDMSKFEEEAQGQDKATIPPPLLPPSQEQQQQQQQRASATNPDVDFGAKSLVDLLIVKVLLKTMNCRLKLSEDFMLKFQLSNMLIELKNKFAKLSLYFVRLLANSPTIEKKWCRLMCMDSLNLSAQIPKSIEDLIIDIHTTAIRLVQPHKFIVYELFQNISITLKTAKHLVKLLKAGNDKKDAHIVHPHQQKAIPLPKINIKSNHLKFTMEDDPFETDLNMIYQLGKVEQRKRIELYDIFDAREKQQHGDSKDYFAKLNRLNETISNLWIRKVNTYQLQLRQEVAKHKVYLFGNESYFDREFNKDVVAYPYHAPLLTIGFENFDLQIRKPEFGINHVADFIHDMGQGVPKDTAYSLLVPMFLDLRVAEMRMQLRDYPLPILHSPRNKNANVPSLIMAGHLVISENMVTAPENLRKITVPLVSVDENELNRFDSLIVEKTLSSVKMYTNLRCTFNSDYPTRIVWGTSYQFGIQQFMLNFDQFSKPPVDPSPKLGFWDKLKYILHGTCSIKTRTSLEVGFKGSRDPYDLLGTATGFILCFKNDVNWDINKDDDSRNFFDITAKKVSWYIPNYLGAPLLVWTRNSNDSVYLPDSPKFISSCFAYYLDDSLTKPDLDLLNKVFAKDVITLSGGIKFRVGFLLQRKVDGKRVESFIPHYDVELMNPDYCDKKGHDSYKGFRSEYIHMAISLTADHQNTYNTIHLSPGAFSQFFAWWKLFASNMMLPIRRGPLFGEAQNSVKFSQHLFTNKFSFYLKSLFISHIYRDEIVDVEEDRVECVGLRAKVEEFSVDLHQRKQPVTLYHEALSKSTKVMKMVFNVGEVSLTGIDMRVVRTSFLDNFYTHGHKNYDDSKSTYDIFGDDRRWFDIQDYEEAFLPSVRKCPRTVKIYPLMYSHKFTYMRDTENDAKLNEEDDEFGNEDIHNCRLNSSNPVDVRLDILKDRLIGLEQQITRLKKQAKNVSHLMERVKFLKDEIDGVSRERRVIFQRSSTNATMQTQEHFHNKFTWLSMLLKWNVTCRDLVLKYVHFVQLKSALRKYLSHESITMLEKVIDRANDAIDGVNSEDGEEEAYEGDGKENTNNKDQGGENDVSSEATTTDQAINNGNSFIFKPKTRSNDMNSKERLLNFNRILKEVNKSEVLSEDYLIEIVAPQIQLQSDESPDSVVLISAPSISSRIVSTKDSEDDSNADVLETRYGNVLRDANVFVLNKKEVLASDKFITMRNPYGAKSNWPPWLGAEITHHGEWAGDNQLLIKNLSVMVLFYNTEVMGSQKSSVTNNQSSRTSLRSSNATTGKEVEAPKRLQVDAPSLVLTSTSSQYFTLYVIVISLLFYSEPMSKFIKDKLEKMKFSMDFENLEAMSAKIKQMQAYYHVLRQMTTNYSFRDEHLKNEDLNDYLQINLESADVASDVYLMLKTLLTGEFYEDTSNAAQMSWLIRADEVILHILEDNREPILDLALANGVYERKELESGSNMNRIQIKMLQGFNLIKDAKFPDFLNPFEINKNDNLIDNMIDLEWTMNRAVGGIQIVEDIRIKALPLEVKIDEVTGEKLLKFIFQTDSTDLRHSKVMMITNSTEAKKEELHQNDFDHNDDEFGFMVETVGANKSQEYNKHLQHERSTLSSRSNNTHSKRKNLARISDKETIDENDIHDDEQVEQMIERAKNYFSIVSLVVSQITLRITIRLNKGLKRIMNVSDFRVDLPEIVIHNRVMSFTDLTDVMKKHIIKALTSHIGSLLVNKLKSRSSDDNADLGLLKPVMHYNKFTPIRELTRVDSVTK